MKRIAILISFFLFMSGASYAQKTSDYLIRGRDVLQITVYDHSDLNSVVRVSESGLISFPLLGEVKVKGLTVHQVEKKLVGLLSKGGIIVKPQVTVFIQHFKAKQVTVIGEVNKPGQYALLMDESTYLIDILSKCLGLTRDAGEFLSVFRKKGEKRRQVSINLVKLFKNGDMSQNIALEDGDILNVSKADYFYIYGQVSRPGYYRVEHGLSLIRAVAMAGGTTQTASTRGIRIVRRIDKKETTIRVRLNSPVGPNSKFFENGDMSLNIPITGDDVIYVPRSAYFYVSGQVNRPGFYKLEPGLTVIRAIAMAGGLTAKASTGRIEIIRKNYYQGNSVAKSNFKTLFSSDSLRELLDKKVVIINENNPDKVSFEAGIRNEKQLKERLKQTDISDPETILALWRKSRESVAENVEMNFPVQAEDVIKVPQTYF